MQILPYLVQFPDSSWKKVLQSKKNIFPQTKRIKRFENGFEKKVPWFENFFPDFGQKPAVFPDWKKSSKISLISLIGGNPDSSHAPEKHQNGTRMINYLSFSLLTAEFQQIDLLREHIASWEVRIAAETEAAERTRQERRVSQIHTTIPVHFLLSDLFLFHFFFIFEVYK